MDTIILENLSKRFQSEWIFRNVNLRFSPNVNYVILGSNGSGKSTLLQCISGLLSVNSGNIEYFINNSKTDIEDIYTEVSLASPYQELIEEFTLLQMLQFHLKFKKMRQSINPKQIIEILGFERHTNKLIRNFSSGMKQRLKLAIAILSDTKILLLDEPCSNLDEKSRLWYQSLIQNNIQDRIVVICSNHIREEYFFCTEEINIENYKNNGS